MVRSQRPVAALALVLTLTVAGAGDVLGAGPEETLRRERMWEFADRLITIVLPRIRDFRGVKDKLDGRGNYTMGLSEQSVFPEIEFDKIEFAQGMDITFVTTAGTDERGHALLKELGMPFAVRETTQKGKKS